MLCGGVGGARMARALSGTIAPDRLTVVVNVGDDDYMYGAHVAADLDTVAYTLAGIEGPHGWGIANDTFAVMDTLTSRGVDTSFRLGDQDLATCLLRSDALRRGIPLSEITRQITESLGITSQVTPATDQPIRTKVQIEDGSWLSFQDYFVKRQQRDTVLNLEYEGISDAKPAPGLADAIAKADLVVLAPSNPVLSIWPILQIPGMTESVGTAKKVVAVSPLFGGKALKGPADRIMDSLDMAPGTRGILDAYQGLLSALVVDSADVADVSMSSDATQVVAHDTRLIDPADGRRFASWLVDTMVP